MFKILALASLVALAAAAPAQESNDPNSSAHPASLDKTIKESGQAIESLMQRAIDEGMKFDQFNRYSRLLQEMIDGFVYGGIMNCDNTLDTSNLKQIADDLEAKRSELVEGDADKDSLYWSIGMIRNRVSSCKTFNRSTSYQYTSIELTGAINGQTRTLESMLNIIAMDAECEDITAEEAHKQLEWVNEQAKVNADMVEAIQQNGESISDSLLVDKQELDKVDKHMAMIEEKLGSEAVPKELKDNIARARKIIEQLIANGNA